jgi:hypothetical protein
VQDAVSRHACAARAEVGGPREGCSVVAGLMVRIICVVGSAGLSRKIYLAQISLAIKRGVGGRVILEIL